MADATSLTPPSPGLSTTLFPNNTACFIKPEAHGPQRSPEYAAMKAIVSQNTVNVACNKNEPFVCYDN